MNFNQGDIIKMNFNPNSGYEQQGTRPAIVLSNNILNQHSKLLLVCPITNTNKSHPFHIPLDGTTSTTGVILGDQAKMLDLNVRNAVFIETAPLDIIEELKDLVISFIE